MMINKKNVSVTTFGTNSKKKKKEEKTTDYEILYFKLVNIDI